MPHPLGIVLPVRFDEAIRAALRRHVMLPDEYYGLIQAQTRSESFTITGLAALNQVAEALEALNEGLRSGKNFEEWKREALARGWGLPAAQLEVVMRVHAQTAYMRGVYEQALANKERRPYLMYTAINDARARPTHLAMDGIIRHIDDAFWDTHFPPCGFNCRCGVITLTEQQATDRGGPTQHIPIEARADPGWGFRPARDAEQLHERVERRALDAPGPLQDEVRDWHERIVEERLPARVRAAIADYDEIARDPELRRFLREYDGLVPEHEAVALRAYTGEHYAAMNAFMRGQRGGDLNMLAAVSAAASGLSKLTVFGGTVYRGVRLAGVPNAAAFRAAHVAGEVVEYQAFTSASYGVGFEGDVIYRIRSRTGREVERISLHAPQQEVLFLPGTQFRIVSAETRNGTLLLELEEIANRVTVPDSHKFEDDFDRAKRGEAPQRPASEALQARMDSEVGDPEQLARFRAEHGGMSPVEYALSQFPSAALEVQQYAPHLVKKPKPKPAKG